MNRQEQLRLQKLASGIGQFIRYWGFRNIHGEIWSVVYLHKSPLSGIEIGRLLKVSKALVSPALRELVAEGLIRQVESENSKTKRYEAVENIIEVIHGVLRRREKPMIEKIQQDYRQLSRDCGGNESLNLERLCTMGQMIEMAQMGLISLLSLDSAWEVETDNLKQLKKRRA